MYDKKQSELIVVPEKGNLFDKVVSILEQARSNVVKSVNSNMIIAYWLIGQAIVIIGNNWGQSKIIFLAPNIITAILLN